MIHSLTILLLTITISIGLAAEPAGLTKLKSLQGNPEACRTAMNSSNPVLRRAAFRCLLEEKDQARSVIEKGLQDRDPLIRQRALYEGYNRYGNSFLPSIKAMIKEDNLQVGLTLIAIAKTVTPPNQSTDLLKAIADQAGLPEIRRQASRLVNFTFYRENRRLKDNPAFDHDIVTVKSWALPETGWRFRADPMITGQNKNYFAPGFDDSNWRQLKIGFWEQQGYPGYDGVAWYRIRFRMPKKIDSNGVELSFGAVDESAWVWVNGEYIGQHDIGPKGWDRPFALDVTREIKWDAENTLVVRVEDTSSAGGIWKPVKIEILK